MKSQREIAITRELDICLERMSHLPDGGRIWQELYYAQPEGYRALTMRLAVPAGATPAPVVVYIHGGGWLFGHPNVQHPHLAAMALFDKLHAAGYAVARASYRLSAEGRFPTQLHDLKAAIRYLRHHATCFGIDAARIGVIGESAGGHLAVLLGLDTPPEFEGEVGITGPASKVQAVVSWYGITDFLTLDAQRIPGSPFTHDTAESASSRLLGQTISANPDAARAASPVTWVTADAAPCLIQHGTDDLVVPPGQGRELFEMLQASGVPAEFSPVAGASHCFVGADTVPVVADAMAFLDQHLRHAG